MLIKRLWIAAMALSFAGTAQASELMSTMHHRYLLGEWSCVGQVNTPDGRSIDTVGAWKIKRAFHGHVYDKFENHTGDGFTYVAKGMTSYDKLAGVLNRHVISSMGTWTRYVSTGWDGDTLTWNGESHRFGHAPRAIDEVVKKKDDNTIEVRVRVPGDDGKDGSKKNMYVGTCSRKAGPGGHGGGHGGGKDDGKDDGVEQGKQDQGKQDGAGELSNDIDADDADGDVDAGW